MTCPSCRSANDDDAPRCASCGAPLAVPAGALLAGRYEVKALLGRGGMGAVYRAHDRVVDEDVAVKVLDEAERTDEPARRWLTEIRLARQVTHPNVCRIHDCGDDGARRWISMELVDGETVGDLLRGGPLPPERAWDVAIQAADGLAAVHRAGVVHRDLKTVNLTVDRGSRVRVMDFGIAAPAASADTGERGYLLGSPEYISPEQARGRPADARSDVYALGVVVFELFTGRVPFRAETPVETLLLHLETPPPLDDERLPRPLRPVLARALAKEPGGRYADAGALAAALRDARGGESSASAEPTLPRERRPRRGVALAAAVGALAVAGVVVALAVRDRSPAGPASEGPEPVASPAAAPAVTSAEPPPPLERSHPAEPARSPDQPGSSAAPTPTTESRPSGVPPAGSDAEPRAGLETAPPAVAEPVAPPRGSERGESTMPLPMAPAEPDRGPGGATPPVDSAPQPTPAAEGALLVLVRPWADVSVDGVPVGQTPLAAIPLTAGPHQVLLTHPDYQDYPRRVTIRAGETARLEVDLSVDAVRRPR